MSSGQEQAIESARERARSAGEGTRAGTAGDSRPSTIRLGRIAAVLAGSYTVDVMGANGVADTVPGVTAWGSATYLAGEQVTLAWIGDRPIPFIIGGGSSGGGSGAPFVTACLLANGE